MFEVQRAIWLLFGQPAPDYGIPNDQTVVDCLIKAANDNAATWVPQCGDKVAVIFNVDVNWNTNLSDVQLLFLEVPVICIGDFVWKDLNGNGIQDANEPGVPGVTVQLRDCNNNFVQSTVTGPNGEYGFTVPKGGQFEIKFVLPVGYDFSLNLAGLDRAADSNPDPLTGIVACATYMENDFTLDAGLIQRATIGNQVFYDLNANGVQDGGAEVGVDGVTVELFTCANISMGSMLTAGGGFYSFTVPPGSYYVKFSNLPLGYIFTTSTPGLGAKDPTDSDANPSTGITDCVTLAPGENDPTWDAGLVRLPTLALSCVSSGTGAVGTPYNSSLVASGGTAPYAYSIILPGALPPGLTLDPATGAITGTPTVAGSFTFTAKVEDAFGNFTVASTVSCTIRINPPECVDSTFTFSGNTATSGTAGNVRLFTVNGISVKARAFSRVKPTPGGNLVPAYLGAYGGGLGVTDTGEGSGSGNSHTVDNIDRDNFVLFEFSQPVVLNRAFLGYVVGDSDLTAWMGNATDPFNNPLVLSDTILNGLTREDNLTGSSSARWANINAGDISGNVLVIAARLGDSDDSFKIGALEICGPINPVTLACVSKVTGTVGTAYSSALVAAGGTPAYTFTITAGTLPAGLALNSTGAITGTPTVAGTFAFTAKVVDSTGTTGNHTATVNCTITVGSVCAQGTFTFSGSTSTYGTAGNIRTFTVNGISVKASAFSRVKPSPGGALVPAYLGAYGGGLGATDTSEGSGGNNSHTVDNIGRNNFVLFEFSQPVVVNRAFLGYVVSDSDLSVWIGNATDPFNNHLALSDTILNGLTREDNTTTSSSTRWADINAGNLSGNVLVIAGWLDDTTPEDQFKIGALDICSPSTPLTLACVANGTGTVGTAYSSALVATGGKPSYIYSITAPSVLPGGLTLNPATGLITGTPTTAGTFAFTAKVVDSSGGSGAQTVSKSCSIVISPQSPPPVTLACVSNGTGTVGTAYSSSLVAGGGTPAYTFSLTAGSLPPGLALNTLTGAITGTPTTAGTFAFTAKVVDSTGTTGTHTASQNCSIVISTVQTQGCLTLTKTASKTTVAPFEPVVYSYVVRNCGNTALTNILVTDDNGTPTIASDDFTVGTVASLAPGASTTLTATVIPVVCTVGVVNGVTVPAGSIVVTTLVNGDIKATYFQSFGINDNTYGTGSIGWPGNNHTFGNLTGSDKLQFRFFNKNGTVAIDFYMDTITAGTSVTVPGTGVVISYPSGYGTKGPFGGDGSMVAGNPNNIVTFSTSITDNLNHPLNLPKTAALIVNSPTSLAAGNVVVDPVKAPGGWDHINSYMVVIKAATFTAGGGFGGIAIPDQHNSPNKLGGPNGMVTTVTNCTVINTAKAKTGTLTATATATVSIVASSPPGSTLPSPWQTKDIGSVGATGSASYANSTFTLNGAGNDLGGKDCLDEFRFVYQTGTGDCTMLAKVESIENTSSDALAGVMIRETLESHSKHAGVFVTRGKGIRFASRNATGGNTADKTVSGVVAPYWVKIVRTGNTFTTYRSSNGTTWTQVDLPVTISMGASVYIGLVVNSHKDSELCTATFSNVTATP